MVATAQTSQTTGAIRGIVKAHSGQPLAETKVSIHSREAGFTRVVLTDAKGAYILVQGEKRTRTYTDGNGAEHTIVELLAADFRPSPSQRRVLRANADIIGDAAPNKPSSEQYALFRRYLDSRHPDGGIKGKSHFAARKRRERNEADDSGKHGEDRTGAGGGDLHDCPAPGICHVKVTSTVKGQPAWVAQARTYKDGAVTTWREPVDYVVARAGHVKIAGTIKSQPPGIVQVGGESRHYYRRQAQNNQCRGPRNGPA